MPLCNENQASRHLTTKPLLRIQRLGHEVLVVRMLLTTRPRASLESALRPMGLQRKPLRQRPVRLRRQRSQLHRAALRLDLVLPPEAVLLHDHPLALVNCLPELPRAILHG